MSPLFDQNLPRRLPILLAPEFPGAEQVLEIGLANADDRVVWSYAATRGLTIVSKDSDFEHLSARTHPQPFSNCHSGFATPSSPRCDRSRHRLR